MIGKFERKLRENSRTIVFTEGCDKRIQESAERLTYSKLLNVILLGNENEVKESAKKNDCDISLCKIIDPLNYSEIDAMVEEMVKIRKGKMTEDQVRRALEGANYFGTMLVKMGKADCLLGGATYSTADTVRPALQIIKTKPGNKIVSSSFVMIRGEQILLFSDCSICINPTEDEVAEIAVESAKTARIFGLEPKVALLSYSTYGSGKGESVTKMANAAAKVKEMEPFLKVDGEIQFDAAISDAVAAIKCPGSQVGGQANVLVFPDINAGNIGYKIAARLGNFEAIGPILQGMNAPINDLSRGCTSGEVYKMAIITAALS
jgi:phosphate acetyltransferase